MFKIFVEIFGIIATIIVLIAMCFKTTSRKGSIYMRLFNLIGSIGLTIYGCLIPAISTAILNGALVFINIYHLILLLKNAKN